MIGTLKYLKIRTKTNRLSTDKLCSSKYLKIPNIQHTAQHINFKNRNKDNEHNMQSDEKHHQVKVLVPNYFDSDTRNVSIYLGYRPTTNALD